MGVVAGKKKDEPIAGSAPIHRAREDAPIYSSEKKAYGLQPVGSSVRLQVASKISTTGYTLEAHIPAVCLVGFDPSQHQRIGFYYMLEDRDHPQQFLTAGDDLNWHIGPLGAQSPLPPYGLYGYLFVGLRR